MKTICALCYFHRKIGPLVFYSYPEGILDEDLSVRIANIMDQTFSEGFFTHSFETLNSMNYYFEIHSEWARGNKDMLMVSIIFDEQTSPEIEQNVSTLCFEFSEKLQSNDEIFKAFYINDISNYEGEKGPIVENEILIKAWVNNLYWAIIENTREKSEEEKIAILLNKNHIFQTLENLSKGPKTLEELKDWFSECFPNKSFDKMIETLVDKQIIVINQIGMVEKYILLLKEVNAERIPPDSVIEFIDENPEIIALLLPKVQEYFSIYENLTEEDKREDAFLLFQIMSDPKKYNLLSEVRNGLIRRDQLPKLVSKKALDSLIENIDFLKKYDVIQELQCDDEVYIVLKTNLQITTAFPSYLRKLLTKEEKPLKPVIASTYNPSTAQQEEIAEIFKVVRDKEVVKPTKDSKISTFLEDLSSSSKKNPTKR